jgi:hypothetical protein
MGRAWRIEFEGALYHTLSRGNERKAIFYCDDDRHLFLDTLGEMSERFAVDIFAYVSHIVKLIKPRMPHEPKFQKEFDWINLQFKM